MRRLNVVAQYKYIYIYVLKKMYFIKLRDDLNTYIICQNVEIIPRIKLTIEKSALKEVHKSLQFRTYLVTSKF